MRVAKKQYCPQQVFASGCIVLGMFGGFSQTANMNLAIRKGALSSFLIDASYICIELLGCAGPRFVDLAAGDEHDLLECEVESLSPKKTTPLLVQNVKGALPKGCDARPVAISSSTSLAQVHCHRSRAVSNYAHFAVELQRRCCQSKSQTRFAI